MKVPTYKCFYCDKKIANDYLRVRVRCPYCGDRRVYKERDAARTVKAI